MGYYKLKWKWTKEDCYNLSYYRLLQYCTQQVLVIYFVLRNYGLVCVPVLVKKYLCKPWNLLNNTILKL